MRAGLLTLSRLLDLSENGFSVVPIYGTGLGLFRNGGSHEMMPWDIDADLVIFQPRLNFSSLHRHLEKHFAVYRDHKDSPIASPFTYEQEVHLR